MNLPHSFLVEDGEESDADATPSLYNHLDKLATSLEVMPQHEAGRLSHQTRPDPHHNTVTADNTSYRDVITNAGFRDGGYLISRGCSSQIAS